MSKMKKPHKTNQKKKENNCFGLITCNKLGMDGADTAGATSFAGS
jgi:hypothetical protein